MAKVVLVTGGSSGIGAELVRHLAGAGYRVLFTYNSSKAQAQALIASLEAQPTNGRVEGVACNFSDLDRSEAVIRELLEREGPIHAFVHSAGMSYDKPATVVDLDAAENVMRVNFLSLVAVTKLVLRGMLQQRSGRIVAISSVAALIGRRGNAIYSASKAAAEGYLRCLVDEVRDRGVTVNWVQPGLIRTRMVEIYPGLPELANGRVPMGRMGETREVAEVVGFLLSPAAAYLHGAQLAIDGGLSATMGMPTRNVSFPRSESASTAPHLAAQPSNGS